MNKSEQAQAIEEVKLWFSLGRGTMKSSGEVEARKRVSDLLEIVDSQAQKIATQAKEIERLKAANDAAEKARINSSLNEYYRKSL